MGMRFGMVAVKAEVAQFVNAFTTAWPHHEPKIQASLPDLASLDAWIRENEDRVLSGGRSTDNLDTPAFAFWQDGAWAIMLDLGQAHASNRNALVALSERFGFVLSFILDTPSGSAWFDAFDQGRLVRRIQAADGTVETEGARLPQEGDFFESLYFVDETEQLQQAFGITPLERVPPDTPVIGAAFIDRTDYRALAREQPAVAAQTVPVSSQVGRAKAKQSWWRFW